MMDRRHVLQLGFGSAVATGLGLAPSCAEEVYPSRSIRLVVPVPAGGAYDIVARPLAQALHKALGRPVVVENKSGADGTIGATDVARSAPDGYTLLFGASPTHVFAPVVMENLPYDPRRDFAEIAVTGKMPVTITVHAQFPVKTLKELIALVKAKPGQLRYAASGIGARAAMELFKQRYGLDVLGVPYRGTAPAVTDVIARHLDIYPGVAGSVTRLHNEGVFRVLAVLDDTRVAAMPEVPTAAEAGVPDLILYSFNVICAPAGTPVAILEKLNKAINKFVSDPAMVALQRANGIEPVLNSTLESATKLVYDQIEELGPILRASQAGQK
jgi:tripartite-type tricarboxylate transporter receptor subunit TctC